MSSLKHLSQPFKGSVADFLDVLNPVRTTAQLVAIADEINTVDKYTGRRVWDSTLGQPVWADGPLAGDTWSLSTGVVSTTPA